MATETLSLYGSSAECMLHLLNQSCPQWLIPHISCRPFAMILVHLDAVPSQQLLKRGDADAQVFDEAHKAKNLINLRGEAPLLEQASCTSSSTLSIHTHLQLCHSSFRALRAGHGDITLPYNGQYRCLSVYISCSKSTAAIQGTPHRQAKPWSSCRRFCRGQKSYILRPLVHLSPTTWYAAGTLTDPLSSWIALLEAYACCTQFAWGVMVLRAAEL